MYIYFTSHNENFDSELISELAANNHTILKSEPLTQNIDFVLINENTNTNNRIKGEAQALALPIGTEAEFLYAYFREKTRVVIAGEGKEEILKMIIHTFDFQGIPLSFYIEKPIAGKSVCLVDNAEFVLFEGSEKPISETDQRPKFLVYQPTLALLEGISTKIENYTDFVNSITKGGILVYSEECENGVKIAKETENTIRKIGYKTPDYEEHNGVFYLITEEGELPLSITKKEEIRYVEAAKWICQNMGIDATDFYEAIAAL